MEPIIQAIIQLRSGCSLHNTSIDMLAYADELTLMSETPIGLQAMLDTAGWVASWAGLRFNPRKCVMLHIDSKIGEDISMEFHILESIPPALSEKLVYRHLVVPTGYHAAQSANRALKDIYFKLKMISESLLAP
jgi:hypothetical protein